MSFFLLLNTKEDILKNVGITKQLMIQPLTKILDSMATVNSLVANIL